MAQVTRYSVMNALSALLVILTAARILIVCLANPIAGYANNYDFLRQSSCVGVWQVYDHAKTNGHPASPVNAMIFDGDRKPAWCMHSSDNLFPWLAGHLSPKGTHFELRRVGFLKVLVALALLGGVLAQPISPPLRLVLSCFAALAWGDFANTLFFNTLYLDASLLIFSVSSISLAIIACCRSRRPGIGFTLFILMNIAWMCLSRQQYAPFGSLIGLVCAVGFLLRWRDVRGTILVTCAILAIQGSVVVLQTHPSQLVRGVINANLTDTYLGALLPAARDKEKALTWLGLPQSCEPWIGKDWYSPGYQEQVPCPAVFRLGRFSFISLIERDPAMFFVPFYNATLLSRPFLLTAVGHFERPSDERSLVYKWFEATSVSALIDGLPDVYYRNLVFLSCFFSVPALAIALWRGIRLRERGGDLINAALLLSGLGGALSFYAVASSILGDGYSDMPRHAVGILFGIDMQVSAAILVVIRVGCGDGQTLIERGDQSTQLQENGGLRA